MKTLVMENLEYRKSAPGKKPNMEHGQLVFISSDSDLDKGVRFRGKIQDPVAASQMGAMKLFVRIHVKVIENQTPGGAVSGYHSR